MGKTKKRNTRMQRHILQHRLSVLSISCVIVVLAVTLSVASISLHKKNQNYKTQEMELEQQLEEEEARAEEIDELEEYVGTDEYIEDVDSFGKFRFSEAIFGFGRQHERVGNQSVCNSN